MTIDHDPIEVHERATIRIALLWEQPVVDAELREPTNPRWTPTYTPVDLTGWTAAMKIRPTYESDDVIVALTHEASADGQVVLGGATGTVDITVKDEATTWERFLERTDHVWDLMLTAGGGDAHKLVGGVLRFVRSASR